MRGNLYGICTYISHTEYTDTFICANVCATGMHINHSLAVHWYKCPLALEVYGTDLDLFC